MALQSTPPLSLSEVIAELNPPDSSYHNLNDCLILAGLPTPGKLSDFLGYPWLTAPVISSLGWDFEAQRINYEWTNENSHLSGVTYQFQFAENSSFTGAQTSADLNSFSHFHTTAERKTYYAHVRAKFNGEYSEWSNTVSTVTTYLPPDYEIAGQDFNSVTVALTRQNSALATEFFVASSKNPDPRDLAGPLYSDLYSNYPSPPFLLRFDNSTGSYMTSNTMFYFIGRNEGAVAGAYNYVISQQTYPASPVWAYPTSQQAVGWNPSNQTKSIQVILNSADTIAEMRTSQYHGFRVEVNGLVFDISSVSFLNNSITIELTNYINRGDSVRLYYHPYTGFAKITGGKYLGEMLNLTIPT